MLTGSRVGVVLILLAFGSPAGGSEPGGTPVVHEELVRTWDDFARGLHEWAGRWQDHFDVKTSREERPLISFMLRHRERLALSAGQIRALEHLRNDFQREAIRTEADLRIAELDLAALLETEPVDMLKVEAQVRTIERLRADLRFARIRTIERGKEQLSVDQRKKLRELLAEPLLSRLHIRPLP